MHIGSLLSDIAKTYNFGPTPTSGCHGDLWSKNIYLILACDDTIVKKGGICCCTLVYPYSEIVKTYDFGTTSTSGCRGDLWTKNLFLIFACDVNILKKEVVRFCTLGSPFPRSLKQTVLVKEHIPNIGLW